MLIDMYDQILDKSTHAEAGQNVLVVFSCLHTSCSREVCKCWEGRRARTLRRPKDWRRRSPQSPAPSAAWAVVGVVPHTTAGASVGAGVVMGIMRSAVRAVPSLVADPPAGEAHGACR